MESDTADCSSGDSLPWVEELRYRGVAMKRSRMFKCSLDYAKKGFYRAANGIFGKFWRIASEEVILQLIFSKCSLSACEI